MTHLDALMIRHLLAPVPHRGMTGIPLTLAAMIVACEVRTMGMGLQRSDGRNAGIADPVLLQIAHLFEAVLSVF